MTSPRLPPLNACRVFEVAARHESFARASTELNVTPAAVSHQVRLLEGWLGYPLFKREVAGLVLTDQGRALLPCLHDAFAQIVEAVDEVGGARRQAVFSISVHPNFALKWLVPRLKGFAAGHPELRIDVETRSQGPGWSSDDRNVAIRYLDVASVAAQEQGGIQFDLLFSGSLFPVASPALIRDKFLDEPPSLAGCTLLHVIDSLDDWPRWLTAAGVAGVAVDRGPRFDSYALSVEAALSGWGVALAREDFVGADLLSGRLAVPFPLRLESSRAWFLLSPRQATPSTRAFREWLLAEAHAPATVAGRMPAMSLSEPP